MRYRVSINPIKRFCLTLCVMLCFVLSQNIASAHVGASDDDLHDQNCVVCVVQSHFSDSVVLAAPILDAEFTADLLPAVYDVFVQTAPRTDHKTRAPPPRGPPTL